MQKPEDTNTGGHVSPHSIKSSGRPVENSMFKVRQGSLIMKTNPVRLNQGFLRVKGCFWIKKTYGSRYSLLGTN